MHDKTNFMAGLRAMARPSLCPWDDYYPRMAQTDFALNRHEKPASKTYFIRKAPFGGSYALISGITDFIRQACDYRFTPEVSEVMKEQGYRCDFLEYLESKGGLHGLEIFAPEEGSLLFPQEPGIVIRGRLWQVRLAEGMLLEAVNYPTLAMTKWSRVVYSTGTGTAMEFARRRAQDHLKTTLYAYLAGCSVTSNSEIRSWFNIPTVGTMGHEWVQSFGNEEEAFDKWVQINPDRPALLVDTVDTLASGVPNAIKSFKKHRDAIRKAGGKMGVRLDSGDLAYLALEACRMLNAAGLDEVKVFMTNDLDEYSIETIRRQIERHSSECSLDYNDVLRRLVWACGTKPGTCWEQPSIGGVAKLTTVSTNCLERPVIKLARDNPIKTSIPGLNLSTHFKDKRGVMSACLIHGIEEDIDNIHKMVHPDDATKTMQIEWEMQREVRWHKITVGKNLLAPFDCNSLEDVRENVWVGLRSLHWSHRRLENPHTVKVGLSPKLFELRQRMIQNKALID